PPASALLCISRHQLTRPRHKIMSALSNACAALLLLAATPTCEAFVASSSPYTRRVPTITTAARCRSSLDGLERPLQQQQRQGERSGRTGTMMMAVSHAAAEEISNMEDVPKLKDPVAIADFEALDIRVGRIVLAELIPDPDHGNKPSRKYLSLVVDLGNEKRRVVSAVRSIVDVEDAIGKAVLMAANVEEETILGLPSRGKLLSGSNFSKEPMPRTLRTVLLGGGGVPPGSAVSGL
ncbi:unnamed protein product, partial [Ectocarpus sp. 12 AP-2014]